MKRSDFLKFLGLSIIGPGVVGVEDTFEAPPKIKKEKIKKDTIEYWIGQIEDPESREYLMKLIPEAMLSNYCKSIPNLILSVRAYHYSSDNRFPHQGGDKYRPIYKWMWDLYAGRKLRPFKDVK